jgi:drug/metabolite transporter (DMT)-like permease
MSRRLAIVLILVSAVGFGSIAVFAKHAYAAGASPSVLLALRFALAVAILAPVVWLRGLRLPRGIALGGFLLMGLLYTAQSQSYFTALLYASSGLVALLLYVYPVLVTAMAVALGWEKLDWRTCLLLALALGGMVIMLGGNLEGQPLGVALALAAAGIYAVYIVVGGRVSAGVDPLAATLVIMAVAALGNGALAFGGDGALPQGAAAWLAILAIALFSTVMAVACFLVGIKYVGATQTSIVSTAEPVVALCLGVALLGEAVSPGQLAGGAMVLAAVILLALRPRLEPAAAA